MTAATDYVIAAACGFFAISLAARGVRIEWPLGFALGGASAVLGGTWHGFRSAFAARTQATLWMLTLLTFGASAAAFGAGAISVVAPEVQPLTLRLAALTFLGIYVVAALRNPGFATAGRMALLMLITFAAMSAVLFLSGETQPAVWMAACVILNVGGVVVQLRNIAPHARFNHNDLFHVFQLAALGCLYGAVRHGPTALARLFSSSADRLWPARGGICTRARRGPCRSASGARSSAPCRAASPPTAPASPTSARSRTGP